MSLHWDDLKYVGENCKVIVSNPTLRKGRSRRSRPLIRASAVTALLSGKTTGTKTPLLSPSYCAVVLNFSKSVIPPVHLYF